MTHSDKWNAICRWDMTHSYVWIVSFVFPIFFHSVLRKTKNLLHDSTWFIDSSIIWDMTHLYVLNHIFPWDMTHSCVWSDSFPPPFFSPPQCVAENQNPVAQLDMSSWDLYNVTWLPLAQLDLLHPVTFRFVRVETLLHNSTCRFVRVDSLFVCAGRLPVAQLDVLICAYRNPFFLCG